MTRAEYDNTVRDLLGDTSHPARSFAPEEEALGFHNNAQALSVNPLLAEQYLRAAETLSARATENLPALLGCNPTTDGEDPCARRFIASFGRRAFRRPLDEATAGALFAVFQAGRMADFRTGIQLVLQTMLQSPRFLYRVELTAAPAGESRPVKLDGWELASRLSYLLWGSMPDDELLSAAEADKLGSKAEILAQARRMLADARSHDAVAGFHAEWLRLDKLEGMSKDAQVYPEFNDELRALMRAETEKFVDEVVWNDKGDLETLLTAPFSFMNRRLAAFYGAGGPTGDALERVALDATQRAGLLTQASILSLTAKPDQSSPVHRGKFVRNQMLCQELPPPPPDLVVRPPDLDPRLTTRERFSAHSQDPACSGCHQLMDRVGLGFESFDGIGRFRASENGRAVDASGQMLNSDFDGPFNGVAELARKLSRSELVRACMVKQWFRFAYGRGETADDAQTLRELGRQFASGGYKIRELLLALTQTDAFLYRAPITTTGTRQSTESP